MAESIVNLVLSTVSERLLTGLQDAGVPSSQLATVVREGLAQQNPVTDRISVFVHHGDPDDTSTEPKWLDKTVADYGEGNNDFAGYMIGGAVKWWRAFVVEIKCYFIRTQEDRDAARGEALAVGARAYNILRSNPGMGMTDSFGETAIILMAEKITDYESGGPPRSFNWRTKIYFRVLTETAPVFT